MYFVAGLVASAECIWRGGMKESIVHTFFHYPFVRLLRESIEGLHAAWTFLLFYSPLHMFVTMGY